MNQSDIRAALALKPRDVLMLTLVGEAAGEALLSQVAVACCIRNRVLHGGWWGADYVSVCFKKWQFSCWWEFTAKNTQRLYALAETVLASPTPIDSVLAARLYSVADSVMNGTTDDCTNGATHYVTHALLATAPPAWARATATTPAPKPCAHIGSHAYFRLEN